jgi:Protein of unknown function (DUF2723)
MGKRKGQRGLPRNAERTASDATLGPQAVLFGPRAWVAPVIAFACLLALYIATLAPSVMGGDSGELTAAALTGGVPHPPGYPLFAMLARLFAALPLGHSPAWRVNLFSATATAAAAALLCATVALWTRETAAGLVAAALFGTNSVVWLHATSAEVFGLNAMFVALACLLWLCVERTAARRFVFALCFASGLAMCNHHTFVFVGAPLVLRSFWVARRGLGARGIALGCAIGLLGLLPYAYLALASSSPAAISWGDETSLDGFLTHVLRRNYGTFSMGQASKGGAFVEEGTFFPTLWRMLGHAFPRFLWIGPPLAILGFFQRAKDRQARGQGYILACVLGLYVLGFCTLSNLSTSQGLYLTVLVRFCIQSDLLLAMAAGAGVAKLLRFLRGRFAWCEHHARWTPVAAALVFVAGVAAHAGECNQRHNRVFADFVTTAFASLPQNAIVITMGDHLTGSVFYFREVEKLRPDVVHLDRELLGTSWYSQRKRRLYPYLEVPEGPYGKSGWNIKKLLDGNPTRPLVVIDRLDTWDQSWKDGYKLATNGLVHPLVPASQFPTFEQWAARDRKALGNYDVMPALRAREGSWENTLGKLVMTTQGGRAHLALVYSNEAGNAPAPARAAVNLLEDLIAKAGGDKTLGVPGLPGMPHLYLGPTVWKDLGIGYEILSHVDPAYTPKVALAYEKFVEGAAPDDTDLAAARQYVEQHHRGRGH